MKKLCELCDLITKGTTPSTIGAEFTDQGIIFIRSDALNQGRRLDENCFNYIDEKTHEQLRRSQIQKNDVLFSMAGALLGKTAIVAADETPSNTNQAVAIIRVHHETIDYNYVYYYLSQKSVQQYVRNLNAQSAQPNINLQQIGNIEINIPVDKEDQILVSIILSSYDDKIENNIKYINTLESYIASLYKSWFSEFNYPDATGEMHESENLHIAVPRGWKEMKFGKFLIPCSEKIGDIDVPIYSTTNNGIALRDEKFNKSLSKSQNNNKKIVKDDLIFGLSREILNFGVVTAEIGSVSPVYQIFKIDQTVFLPFMLELEIRLNMPQYMDLLQLGAREGQGINRDYLLNKYILVPDMGVQERFAEIYVAIQKKIEKLREENIVLAEIRDTLLPKLMSGELPVKVGED